MQERHRAAVVVAALAVSALALVAGRPVEAQQEGGMVAVTWGSRELRAVSQVNGSTVLVGPTGIPSTSGLAWDRSTQTLFAVTHGQNPDRLHRVEFDTGAATLVGSLGVNGATALDVQPVTGALFLAYDAPGGGSILATANKVTAQVTTIGLIREGQQAVRIGAIAFHPTTGDLIGISYGRALYRVNPVTGSATLLHQVPGLSGGVGLTYDCAGNLYGARTDLVTIDLASGTVTPVGNMGLRGDSVENLTVLCGVAQPRQHDTTTTTTTHSTTSTTASPGGGGGPSPGGGEARPEVLPAGAARPVVANPNYVG